MDHLQGLVVCSNPGQNDILTLFYTWNSKPGFNALRPWMQSDAGMDTEERGEEGEMKSK
jgi:hypothetical protein